MRKKLFLLIIENTLVMNSNQFLHVCGSVIKKESLKPVTSNVLNNTLVAEADKPYANYYGYIPEKDSVPNSLFLFTQRCYSLEEILRFTQKINSCYVQNINVASAIISFSSKQMPAIRIKFFPDYTHLSQLQECFQKQGIEFVHKFQLEESALVQIHKCFVMKEIEPRIFLDQTEKNEAYILLQSLTNYDQFTELITEVHNNGNCSLFDAALAGIIINSKINDFVRIYSEKLNIDLLRCIKDGITRAYKHLEYITH